MPHVLTSSSRIRPWRYFIFHVKHRTTTELTPALADLAHSSGGSKITSCPSSCSPSQGNITLEDWLWSSWTGFFGRKRYTEMKKMEKGIALSLLSFLGDTCLLKMHLPPFFSCRAPFSSKAGVRPGKKGFPPRKRSGRENGPRDLSAAAVGAAPHPDACVKHN